MEKNIKRRCLSPFSVQVFSSQSDEGLRKEPFFISTNLSIDITYAEEGITILPNTLCITRGEGAGFLLSYQESVVSQYRKTSYGSPPVFQKNPENEKILAWGGYQDFQS